MLPSPRLSRDRVNSGPCLGDSCRSVLRHSLSPGARGTMVPHVCAEGGLPYNVRLSPAPRGAAALQRGASRRQLRFLVRTRRAGRVSPDRKGQRHARRGLGRQDVLLQNKEGDGSRTRWARRGRSETVTVAARGLCLRLRLCPGTRCASEADPVSAFAPCVRRHFGAPTRAVRPEPDTEQGVSVYEDSNNHGGPCHRPTSTFCSCTLKKP